MHISSTMIDITGGQKRRGKRRCSLCLHRRYTNPIYYPRLTRTHTVLTGRKTSSSKALEIHKVFPAAFSSSDRFSASAKLLAPDSDGFSCDFCFLRRRCVVTHQGEKARPISRTPSKAQRSGFVRKKEEGASIVQFSPKGGNGTVRASSDVSGVCALVNRG